MGTGGSFPRGRAAGGVELTAHLQLLPKSRKYGSIYPLPHTPSWRSVLLVKHGDNFTFYLFTSLEGSVRFVHSWDLHSPVFTLLDFATLIFFTEQDRQPCVQTPTSRSRSLYLCPPVTGWPNYIPRLRVPFSKTSTTRRATVEAF
jgi:hypothetical protein